MRSVSEVKLLGKSQIETLSNTKSEQYFCHLHYHYPISFMSHGESPVYYVDNCYNLCHYFFHW